MTTQELYPSSSGLRQNCLPFKEVIAQSVENIAPTLTPTLTAAVVFANVGVGTWLTYLLATIGLLFAGLNINQFARRSASPVALTLASVIAFLAPAY